uniref:Uncharacterized protein n=1 Tax=viral metagenome TaxID=1070528 RepID=A0A6C0DE46_9ZZZZ
MSWGDTSSLTTDHFTAEAAVVSRSAASSPTGALTIIAFPGMIFRIQSFSTRESPVSSCRTMKRPSSKSDVVFV